MNPVTMSDLAREAGVSQSTVSLALRDDPRLKAETRQRIQALAQQKGYRPDPALSALVAYRARTRPVADYGKIAILHDTGGNEEMMNLPSRQTIAGLREQCQRLGYDVELFRVHAEPELSMRLSRVLYARGIRGLVALSLRMPELKMNWEHFSTIVLGEYFDSPPLNHIGIHHAAAVSASYEGMRGLGYKKIGFCNGAVSEKMKHHFYLAGYLKCLYIDGISPEKCPPLLFDQTTNWSPLEWLDRHQFDAVLTMVPWNFVEKLQGSKYSVPGNLGVAGFSTPKNDPVNDVAGCKLDYHANGVAAANALQSMLHRGQRGIPSESERIDIQLRGNWSEGATARRQN